MSAEEAMGLCLRRAMVVLLSEVQGGGDGWAYRKAKPPERVDHNDRWEDGMEPRDQRERLLLKEAAIKLAARWRTEADKIDPPKATP